MKKVIPIILMFVGLSSLVFALSLGDYNLLIYIDFEQSGNSMTDVKTNSHPKCDFSYDGDEQQQSAVAPYGTYSAGFDADFAGNTTCINTMMATMKNHTMCSWVGEVSYTSQTQMLMWINHTGGNNIVRTLELSNGNYYIGVIVDGSEQQMISTGKKGTNYCLRWNGTHYGSFANGTQVGVYASTNFYDDDSGTFGMGNPSSLDSANANMDDIMIYNRSLTTVEMADYAVNGMTAEVDSTEPFFTNNQTNGSATTPKINDVVQLNITIGDDTDLENFTVAHNQSGTMTNITSVVLPGTVTSATYIWNLSITMSGGGLGWQVFAVDSSINANASQIYRLDIRNTAPDTPNILYPADGKNYTNITAINYSSGDADGDSLTYQIFINNTLNRSVVDSNITQWNASDGFYNLTVVANDGTDSSANSSVVHFRLDSTAPSWSGNQTNATLMEINGNATFNITIIDNGIGLSFYIFSWNGTGAWDNASNGSISGTSQKLVINKSTNLGQGNTIGYRWYANDSLDQWNHSLLRTFSVANTIPDTPTFQSPTPANNTKVNTNQIINCTHGGTDVNYYLNVSLTGGDSDMPYVINQTETETGHYTFATNFSDGTYAYECYVQNTTTGLFSNSVSRTLILDITTPTIALNPTNSFNGSNISTTNQYQNTIYYNITVMDETELFGFVLNVTRAGVSYFNFSNITLSGHTTFNYTNSSDTSTWGAGVYNITVIVADAHTTGLIKDYDVSRFLGKITFDTEEGNEISISGSGAYSTEYLKKRDRYEFGFNYLLKSTERTFTIKSKNKIYYLPNSKYKGHFVILNNNLNGNWIDFEDVGNDYSVRKIDDYEYAIDFTSLSLDNKITARSIGGLNQLTKNYKWYKGNYTTTSVDSTAYGQTETFILNMSSNSSYLTLANSFFFNGTMYLATKTMGVDYTAWTIDLIIPQPVGTSNNITFYWAINVTQSDTSMYFFNITDTLNVSNSAVDNCSAYTIPTLNITFFNESNVLPIDASFSALFTYSITVGNFSQNYSVSSTSEVPDYEFCLPSNDSVVYSNVEIEYTNSLSDIRRYYLLNVTLTNDTQSIDLLLLDSGLSTLITMIVDDEDDNAISNAYIKTQRWYLDENKYRTVEISRTDYDGTTGQHLVQNTVPYRFIIEKDFKVLPPTPTAATPIFLTTLYFQLFLREPYLKTFESYGKIGYTFDYDNDTRQFAFTYSDTSGISQEGCLKVKHSTGLRTLIDYDTCITANAGTLTYTTPEGNPTYIGTAYIKPSSSKTTDTVLKIISTGGSKLYQIFGESGLFLSIIFAVVLGGLGSMISGPVAIVFFMLGIIMPIIIGITYINYIVLIGIIILGGLIAWRLKR